MKSFCKGSFGLFICFSLITPLQAQKSTARFLLWPPSAKYTAMGGTGVSYCDDGFAGFHNPAGFAFSKITASTGYVQPYYIYANTRIMQYSSSLYTNLGAIGITLTEFWRERQIVINESGDYIGMDGEDFNIFKPMHWEVELNYATRINRNLAAGVNLSVLRIKLTEAQIGAEKGKGKTFTMMFGAGVMLQNLFTHYTYKPEWKNNNTFLSRLAEKRTYAGLNFGLSFINLGSDIIYIDAAQSDPPPSVFSVGVSYWPLFSDIYAIMIACDLEKHIHESATINYTHLGGELLLYRFLALRLGYYLDTDLPTTSFKSYGLGFHIQEMSFNIAWYKKDLIHGFHFDATYSKEL